MGDWLLAHEPIVRMVAFGGVLVALLVIEEWQPRRARSQPRLLRWSSNLGIVVLNTVVLRLTFPIVAVGFAILAQQRGWGLFNLVDVPAWLAVCVSVLLLDAAIYGQHVLFHKLPVLWRLHRMHHADLDFDATTGVRFHPVEIALSMGIKLGVVGLLGAPAVAVLVFEVLLNATAMFNHSNWKLPVFVDAILRKVIVTPDMHRVHHSVHRNEHDANYGFNLSVWDRLFRTYVAQPRDGHDAMQIGVSAFRTQRELWLDRMLWQPLRRE